MVVSTAPAPAAAAAARSPTRPTARIWIAFAAMGVLLVAYLARFLLRSDSYWPLVDGWLVDGFELAVSCLCLARGLVRRSGRVVALVLGVGMLSWALGDTSLTIESLGGATVPVPSVADGFFLGFFPFAYVAVVLFMRGETRQLSTPNWLDGAVAGLGAAAILAAFAFSSVQRLAGGDSLEVATDVAYPVADLLLLFLMVGGTAILSGRSKAPWLLLATGVAINIGGDTFNLFGSTVGSTPVGVTVNAIAWPASLLLMSMAMWLRPGPADPFALQKPTGFLLPGLAAVSGLAILVVGTLHHTGRVAIALATATLIVVGVRLALSARTLRLLTKMRYRQSVTDDLTGLGNRRYLFHVLDAYFADEASAPAHERSLAFLFVDLNRFREINDSFGHPAGDEVLKQLGARLKAALQGSDAPIRLGGDEFAVVLMDADAEKATTVARRIAKSLEEPFVLDAVSPRISASIGIALAPADATDSVGLIDRADVAMYRAKSHIKFGGRSEESTFALYEEEQDFDGGGNRLRLAEELGIALQEGQLVLHYQPQLDLLNDEISAVEALLRWSHPRLGLVPPLKFLPVAEEAGLMGPLTEWVLEQALAQCAAWRGAGRRISVAVNVSATNLLDGGFIDLVRTLLERHALAADALVLEITETSIITEFERARIVISRLRDLGLVVSVDDFGAGFTSLAYLSSLAVAELKLDQTLITRMTSGETEREVQLVRATIDLGHALGMRVVAEGVEDEATLALLSDFGCDLVQGYLIDVPRPAGELTFQPPPKPSSAPLAVRTRKHDRAHARTTKEPSSVGGR
jgi:diguanylate cyclase (GGDEF)-like protein